MSDGPFGVRSAVAARPQRRRLYEVLDHDPTQVDIRFFLARRHDRIRAHGHTVRGIPTDGSPLYPQPMALALGGVPPQVGAFHLLQELSQAVWRAVARLRQGRAAPAPPLPRGRPRATAVARRPPHRAHRIPQRGADLFEQRPLLVRHHLPAAQRAALRGLSRGRPCRRALRALRDEVYRRFDRRGRTDTALVKLAQLRRRVRRCRRLGKSLDPLPAPTLEKALTFRDAKLLPAPSNAVERGNRRYRQMPQAVYRVRTQASIKGRLALALQRDRHAETRSETIACLHQTRA